MPAPKGNKNAVGNDGGRPDTLTAAVLEKARGYLEWCRENPVVTKRTRITAISDTDEEEDVGIANLPAEEYIERIPSVAGLARHIGVGKSTLYGWHNRLDDDAWMKSATKEEKQIAVEFRTVLEEVGDAQENHCVTYGAANVGSARFQQFLLSAKHDYREKSDVTTDGDKISVAVVSFAKKPNAKDHPAA